MVNGASKWMVCVSGVLSLLSCVLVGLLAEYEPRCVVCLGVLSLLVPLGITVLVFASRGADG